jgi:hypothetical protein
MQAHEAPPPVQMVQLLAGFQVSQALYAAAVLGVADHLVAGPAAAETLADATGAHAPALERLLRTLASLGVFAEPEPGVFAITPLGQTLTRSHPGSVRDLAIMWMETHYAPFGELTRTLVTGQPAADHHYGQPFFSWLSVHPEHATRFTAAMANLTNGIKTAAIAALPVDGLRTIVDIGGADGTLLATLLTAHPQLRGVLFDLPHVIADAPKTFAERGLEDRAECLGGDFFTAVPPGRDGYLTSMVLHDWPDTQARQILANIAAAAAPGARLLLLEFVMPPGDTPHMAKMIDLTMLAMLAGKERTERQWHDLLTATGFTGVEIRDTGTPLSIIQATVA